MILSFLLLLRSLVFGGGLAWTDSCSGVTGFNVYYGLTSGGENVQLGSVLCPNTAFLLQGDLLPGFYVVTAYNSYGESAFSNEVQVAQYYFNQVLYDYSTTGQITFKGENTSATATTSSTTWVITAYTYNTLGQLTGFTICTGLAWTARTSCQ